MSLDEKGLWATEPDERRLKSAYQTLRHDPARAHEELTALADRGSVMAMVYIGYAYERGLGINANWQTAVEWYHQAAERGSSLAKCYLGGLLVQQGNDEEARWVLSDEALKQDPLSMYWLAKLALKRQNYEEACQYLENAIKKGHIPSQRLLGGILLRGRFGVNSFLKGLRLCLGAVVMAFMIAKDDPYNPRLRV